MVYENSLHLVDKNVVGKSPLSLTDLSRIER